MPVDPILQTALAAVGGVLLLAAIIAIIYFVVKKKGGASATAYDAALGTGHRDGLDPTAALATGAGLGHTAGNNNTQGKRAGAVTGHGDPKGTNDDDDAVVDVDLDSDSDDDAEDVAAIDRQSSRISRAPTEHAPRPPASSQDLRGSGAHVSVTNPDSNEGHGEQVDRDESAASSSNGK
jgi:hypothetical protein